MPLNPQPDVPYRAFSGAHITAMIGNKRVGSLQALTVSITREAAALYTFGDASPKAFVKGKRAIAGTLVFTHFDRHALLRHVFGDIYGRSFGDLSRDNQLPFTTRFAAQFGEDDSFSTLSRGRIRTINFEHDVGSTFDKLYGGGAGSTDLSDIRNQLVSIYEAAKRQRLQYSDQIPEFDITITMVNESGDASRCDIGGVVLVNEGWSLSIDDLVTDMVFTYVARSITPLTSLTDPSLFAPARPESEPKFKGSDMRIA